jgi:hypothetical protein
LRLTWNDPISPSNRTARNPGIGPLIGADQDQNGSGPERTRTRTDQDQNGSGSERIRTRADPDRADPGARSALAGSLDLRTAHPAGRFSSGHPGFLSHQGLATKFALDTLQPMASCAWRAMMKKIAFLAGFILTSLRRRVYTPWSSGRQPFPVPETECGDTGGSVVPYLKESRGGNTKRPSRKDSLNPRTRDPSDHH